MARSLNSIPLVSWSKSISKFFYFSFQDEEFQLRSNSFMRVYARSLTVLSVHKVRGHSKMTSPEGGGREVVKIAKFWWQRVTWERGRKAEMVTSSVPKNIDIILALSVLLWHPAEQTRWNLTRREISKNPPRNFLLCFPARFFALPPGFLSITRPVYHSPLYPPNVRGYPPCSSSSNLGCLLRIKTGKVKKPVLGNKGWNFQYINH